MATRPAQRIIRLKNHQKKPAASMLVKLIIEQSMSSKNASSAKRVMKFDMKTCADCDLLVLLRGF